MAMKPRNPIRRLAGSPAGDHRENGPEIDEAPFPKEDTGGIKEPQPAGGPRGEGDSRYRAIVESFDGLFYICSPDYRVEFMNPRLIERTGYDGTGEYCYKVLYELNSICPWCVNERVFRGETVRGEVQNPKDGRWYYEVNSPIYHNDGRISKQAMIQDITGLKLAEEALGQDHAEREHRVEEWTAHVKQANEKLPGEIEERRQMPVPAIASGEPRRAEEALYREKERYRLLVEKSPLGIAFAGSKGEVRYINPRFAEIFGYSQEDLPTVQEWHARAYPDPHYRQKVISAFNLDLRESRPGEVRQRTFKVICKDGTEKIINFRLIFLENDSRMVLCEDVTECHLAQEALKESERRFRQLVKHAADELILHDNGKIIEVNQQTCDDLGYSREELLKMTVYDIEVSISPQDLQKIWEKETESSFTVRGVHRRKDGSTFPVEVRVAQFIYGGRRLLLALARDITARVKIEEARRQSELKYRRLVVAAPFGISIIGTNGRYKYLNPKFEKMFGYTLDDIPTGREWFPKAFPDSAYRELVISDWKEEFKKAQVGEVKPRTYRVTCKDGTAKVIAFRPVTLVTGDWLMFYEDITKRVQAEEALVKSEEQYRVLVNQIPAVVVKGYARGRVEFFDRKIESLTGYKKEDFDAGRLKWPDLVLKEDVQRFREALIDALKGDCTYVREYRIRKQDGGTLWIQERGQIFCDLAARIKHISAVLFDISKRKRAEEALRQSEQKLRALAAQLLSAQEDERKRLAAELHDELGHALLSMKLSLRSLEKQLTPEQNSITQEFKKIGRFIGETIKEVRRLYHDLSPGDLEDLGLTEALRDVIEDVATLQKKIKWEVRLDNIDGLFPLPVQTAIYRIVQEALTNIGKHAKPKNVAIVAKKESHGISIIIEDDGRGFEAAKVLERKRSLGLLTMEERVKILGGTFTLRSQKQQGTRISFFVPFPEGD
jgi:PAS domain S-box-containing protein